MRANIAMSYAARLCAITMTLGWGACGVDSEGASADLHVDRVEQQVNVCVEPAECGFFDVVVSCVPDEINGSSTCFCYTEDGGFIYQFTC